MKEGAMILIDFSKQRDSQVRKETINLERSQSQVHVQTQTADYSRLDLIDQIAIGVAHEIRNPLTVIKGYLQLMDNKPPFFRPESRGIIFQELSRIEVFLSGFISLARSKAIKKVPQDLNYILEQLYPAIQAYAGWLDMGTELLLRDNLPILAVDAEEIKELVIHLVRNAIEAMLPQGRLTIGTIQESGSVVLYVSDEGSGIPQGQLEKIFDPFYTTKSNRTGLGLAIGRSIVDRHQGRIEIDSQVGVGTTVRILFPVVHHYSAKCMA
jgi:two-component system, sporulation sensor kinase E